MPTQSIRRVHQRRPWMLAALAALLAAATLTPGATAAARSKKDGNGKVVPPQDGTWVGSYQEATGTQAMKQNRVLDLEESWLIVRAVRATQAIRETFLRADTYPRLTAHAHAIPDLGELNAKMGKYFTRDGKLREEASSELRAIRQRVQQKRAAIQRTLTDVMNRSADAIQEPLIVLRGDRYCIPVRADHRNAVTGILHERSGSGASFFIEPMQAVELNNDLADLLIQEREEILRITRFIASLLLDNSSDINIAIDVAADLDALQACAIFHQTVGASRPLFNADRELHIIDGRHPLLDRPNDDQPD